MCPEDREFKVSLAYLVRSCQKEEREKEKKTRRRRSRKQKTMITNSLPPDGINQF